MPPDRMSRSIFIDANRTNATVQIAIHLHKFLELLYLTRDVLW